MAGDTVSLGEIVNLKGDAENAFGTGGGDATVLPFNQGIAYLSHAADQQNEADKFKYQEFQKNMNDFYTHFDATDITGLSPADEKIIGDKYAQVSKDIADNISVIRNPNSDPVKFGQLKSSEAELQKMIAASKMHKAFDENSTTFVKANPDWHEVNKKAIVTSQSTPTDNWNPYSLEMPIAYSPEAVAKLVEPIAKQKYAEATAYKGYITEEEGARYKKQAWDDAWTAIHSTSTPQGQSLMDNARKAWDKLPAAAKLGNFQQWFETTRDALRPQDEVTKKTITADPLTEARERNALTAKEGAANRWNQYRIALLGLEKDKKVDVAGVGRLYNEELTGFKTGVFNVQALQNIYGDDAKVKVKAGTKIVDPQNPLSSTETSAETDVPKKLVISAALDANGNMVYKYIDYGAGQVSGSKSWYGKDLTPENIGGYEVKESAPVTFKQGRTDFYNLLGDKNGIAARVADVAEKFRIQRKLDVNPNLDQLNNYFWKPETPAANPANVQTKKGKDGKVYSSTDGVTWTAPDGTVVKLK